MLEQSDRFFDSFGVSVDVTHQRLSIGMPSQQLDSMQVNPRFPKAGDESSSSAVRRVTLMSKAALCNRTPKHQVSRSQRNVVATFNTRWKQPLASFGR